MSIIGFLFVLLIGFLFGALVGCTLLCDTFLKDGTLSIDTTNPEKDCYLFMISKPLDRLPKKKRVHLRIARQTKNSSQVKQLL